jgi:pSer/pThr/pTyr-binding forkhead associated (FHA) protein
VERRIGTFEVRAAIRPGARATLPSIWLVHPDGTRVALRADDPVTVGRLPECDVVTADPNVSRRHAEIRLVDGVVRVVDLGSLNGTQVNGRGVPAGEHGGTAAPGDRITVGSITLTVEAGDR